MCYIFNLIEIVLLLSWIAFDYRREALQKLSLNIYSVTGDENEENENKK